jgi:hypothetical protein
MGDLEERIREGEYEIEVRDTRMGEMVVLNKGGERTLDPKEQKELEQLLQKYEDVVLRLFEADNELCGHERAWKMGEIYHEEVNESNERQIHTLNLLLPFASERNRVEYLYRLFYEMFPDQGYEESYAVMVLAEIAQRSDPNKAREIYDNHLRGEDCGLSREEVRAWAETSSLDSDEIAAEVSDRVTDPDVNALKNVYRLHGSQDSPDEEELEKALAEKIN